MNGVGVMICACRWIYNIHGTDGGQGPAFLVNWGNWFGYCWDGYDILRHTVCLGGWYSASARARFSQHVQVLGVWRVSVACHSNTSPPFSIEAVWMVFFSTSPFVILAIQSHWCTASSCTSIPSPSLTFTNPLRRIHIPPPFFPHPLSSLYPHIKY